MTLHLRRLRRPLFAATAVAALGIGVPAALALTDGPERPRLAPLTTASEPAVPTPTPASAAAPAAAPAVAAGPAGHEGDGSTPNSTSTTSTSRSTSVRDAADDGPGDLRGPCDEAEHGDDPRCTGATAADEEDRSGSDSGHDDEADDDEADDDEDRSGSNSGKG